MCADLAWATLCRYRARLIIAEVPKGTDRNEELKRRLRLWEQREIDELMQRVLGQQVCQESQSRRSAAENRDKLSDDEAKGKRACIQAAMGIRSKAMKGLVGGVASGSSA